MSMWKSSVTRRGKRNGAIRRRCELPRRCPVDGGETIDSGLRERLSPGVIERYAARNNPQPLPRAREEGERERALITKVGFADYFLLVWVIVQLCKRNTVVVRSRGGGA